jgi:hypothetical protein
VRCWILLSLTACIGPATDADTTDDGCDLRGTAAGIAGPGATDCGQAAPQEDTTAIDACIVEHLQSGEPFFAIVANTGTDSVVTAATVQVDGHLWLLSQDSFDGEDARIDGRECIGPTPTDAPIDGGPPFTCERYEPERNHYEVCGDFCPGGVCDDDVPRMPFPAVVGS